MVVPYQGLQVILDLKVEQKRPQIDFNVFNQMNIKFASSIQTQKNLISCQTQKTSYFYTYDKVWLLRHEDTPT